MVWKNLVASIVLFFVSTAASPHTREQRIDQLVGKLYQRYDASWINTIFYEQRLCEGMEKPIPQLPGKWSELRERVLDNGVFGSVLRGSVFYTTHRETLEAASEKYGGGPRMPFIITAILRIETDFGVYDHGTPVIRTLFDRYARVVDGPSGDRTRMAVFTERIQPFLDAAFQNEWDVCQVRGSRAGAFGLPQFIPASLYLTRDGDSDGKVDIVGSVPDAIYSVASHLTERGWRRSVHSGVFNYNRHQAYVAIVLAYAAKIESIAAQNTPQS